MSLNLLNSPAESQNPPTKPAKRRRFVWLKWLILTPILLLILLLAGLTWLITSETGTRQLVEIAKAQAPGELVIAKQSGTLARRLTLHDLRYRQGELDVQIEQLDLQWQPFDLINQRLTIDLLRIDASKLKLPQTAEEPAKPAEPFSGIELPIHWRLAQVEIHNFALLGETPDQNLLLHSVELSASGQGSSVQIEHLQTQAFDARVKTRGELSLLAGLPLDLQLDWDFSTPDQIAANGQGKLKGDLRQLEITQAIELEKAANPAVKFAVQATVFDLETAPRFSALLDLSKANLQAMAPALVASAQGKIQLEGDLKQQAIMAQFALNSRDYGPLALDLLANFANKRLEIKHLITTNPNDLRLTTTGSYQIDNQLGQFDLMLDWQKLAWPLLGDATQMSSQQGKISLQGTPANYAFQLDAEIQLTGLPQLNLQGQGKGTTESMQIRQLVAHLPEGKVTTSGKVSWLPQIAFALQVQGEKLNPGLFATEFPGDLKLAAKTNGQLIDDQLNATVKLAKLEGDLRNYPLSAKGNLALQGSTLQIDGFKLSSGPSQLALEGKVGEQLALNFLLDAPDLASLLPDLSGELKASGNLTGKAQSPRIQADLSGKKLNFQKQSLEQIHGNIDIAIEEKAEQAPLGEMHMDLTALGLSAGGQSWQKLVLQLRGKPAEHALTLKLTGIDQAPSLALALSAGLDKNNRWAGQISQLKLDLEPLGPLHLRQATGFTLAEKAQSVEPLCLASTLAEFCLTGQAQNEQGWQAEINSERIDLALLKPYLPSTLKLKGLAQLHGQFQGDEKGQITGQSRLTLPAADFPLQVGETEQRFNLAGSRIQADFTTEGADLSVQIPLEDLGAMKGDVQLPGLQLAAPDLAQQAIVGRLQGEIAELAWLAGMSPQLKQVQGRLALDFSLQGPLNQPALQGKGELTNGAFELPALGLKVQQVEFAALAKNLDRLSYSGSLQSGSGKIVLTGSTRLDAKQGFPTELTLAGKDWQAVNVPEAEVHLSPNLTIKHAAAGSSVEGEVRIPFARIRPRAIPKGAVSSSADLVIVEKGEKKTPVKPAENPFSAKVRIIFGSRVNFDGFGLRTPLGGDLLLIDEPGRPVFGRGRINVNGGTYRAYGQDLTIERGYLLFADTPVDNPGLDVNAVRQVDDITAGIQVSGTLRKPSLSIFSNPSMTQSEALSYLLFGRPPTASAGGDADLSAALAAAGAGEATTELGRQLGLDDLRLQTSGNLSDASLVAGTYLSPRLYVQYVNDLATRSNSVRLRYDLTEQIQLQSETGKDQGVDVFYKIER